ncbi:MAG TPA: class I SAM-dependent methyltransferase, partial [Ignavibacteriaceae bacterium]
LEEILNECEVQRLVKSGIITYNDGNCISQFRIIPIDDLMIIYSPQSEFDTPKYVYLGEDSVVFYYLLKEEIIKKVNNALEIGCGTGLLSVLISKIANNVTSVDINNRALEFTNLNARINGIDNITTKQSNVYSGVEGKFDLIISNPPYVYLPEENIGRTFAYGGKLGIEILEKILIGLDDHLSDTGTCYMIFFSYIKEDGTNTAYEMIEKVFRGKPYAITLKQIDYYPIKYYPSFYKQQGLSHTIRYLIKVQKSSAFNMKHIKIRGIDEIVQKLKIKF